MIYNRIENEAELDSVRTDLQKLDNSSNAHVERINEKLINKALKRLKANKKDAVFDTVSDMYINGPTELSYHLKNLIQMYLIHGVIPQIILLCTLAPLVTDSLGDITSSNNYRAIAGGSLMLKLIDLVILILEGEKLKK